MYHKGDDGHNISVSLPYLMGFVVVIVTLSILMGICMGIGQLVQRYFPDTPSCKQATPTPAMAPAEETDQIPDHILTVIAAATAAMCEDIPHRIVAVIAASAATVVDEPHKIITIKENSTAWSQEGRHQIQTSHNLR